MKKEKPEEKLECPYCGHDKFEQALIPKQEDIMICPRCDGEFGIKYIQGKRTVVSFL